MKNLLFTLALILISFTNYAATCVSLGNGNWEDPLTWSCGAVPSPGDTIIIDAAHTVYVTSNNNLTGAPVVIIVNGELQFSSAGAKLRLECGSTVFVNVGGQITDSGVGTPSHEIIICGTQEWHGSQGTLVGPVILGTPLPVELVGFTINQDDFIVFAQWETASEYNNDYFTLQGSADGTNWTDLVFVNGSGTTSETQYYQTEYDNRNSKLSYFRLKQTDYNGASSFSKVLTVKMSFSASLTAFPNPVNGSLLTVLWEDSNNSFDVLVSDLSGRTVATEVNVTNGQVVFDTDNWLSGYYVIQVKGGGITDQVKLVKP